MSELVITSNPDKETATTVTLEWTPPSGAAGYVFVMKDGKRSSTLDPTRDFLKVAKSNLPVTISALRTLVQGVYPPVAPPPDPDPDPSEPVAYARPSLVVPKTYVVPQGATVVNLDKTQRDWIIDFGWIERKTSVLIYGWAGQRFLALDYWANIDKAVGGSAYGRGGPRVRSNDGVGPEEAYFDRMLVGGSTVADAFAVDAGLKTLATIAHARLECSRDTSGKQFADGTEHIDQVQTQGKIGGLRLSVCTINLSDQANPTDAGGKGLMLHKETGGPFKTAMQYVNFVGKGRVGAVIFQNTPDITIEIGPGVYMDLAEVTSAYKWAANSPALYPGKWDSTGTAPNRVCTPRGVGWSGQILEGRPPGGDYVTRAVKP